MENPVFFPFFLLFPSLFANCIKKAEKRAGFCFFLQSLPNSLDFAKRLWYVFPAKQGGFPHFLPKIYHHRETGRGIL